MRTALFTAIAMLAFATNSILARLALADSAIDPLAFTGIRLASGAAVLAMILFQVFENIGMTMGIMPITGIPLPFLSYGGSSTLTMFAAIGLVLNVHTRRFS